MRVNTVSFSDFAFDNRSFYREMFLILQQPFLRLHLRSKLIPMQCDVVFVIFTTSTFMFSTPMWFVMEEEIANIF